MASKKASGSTGKNRDSVSKRLGVKLFGGQKVYPGNIIIRQKGSNFYPGIGTKKGNDFTIFAVSEGVVKFFTRQGKSFVQIV